MRHPLGCMSLRVKTLMTLPGNCPVQRYQHVHEFEPVALGCDLDSMYVTALIGGRHRVRVRVSTGDAGTGWLRSTSRRLAPVF